MQKVLLQIAVLILLCVQQTWAAEEEKEEGEEVVSKTSAYIPLGDSMVLNLSNQSSRLSFLQLKADVLIDDSASEDLIKTHIPAIRHQLIVLLSEQKAIDMKSPGKREEIRKIATAQVQELISELTGTQAVTDVLFSSFLVQ